MLPIVIAMTLDEVLFDVKNQSNLDISCSHLFFYCGILMVIDQEQMRTSLAAAAMPAGMSAGIAVAPAGATAAACAH